MGLRPLEIFYLFQNFFSLYMSESDVYRRQILTYKDVLCAEGVDSSIQSIYFNSICKKTSCKINKRKSAAQAITSEK